MPNWSLPPARYIDRASDLHALTAQLAKEPILAIDTESNSLHAYREQVCLFQVSSRSADYIIDPLALKDLAPLGKLLADPAIEKVFHAAEYDLICLKRDFGFTLHNLFDTMVAARICGHKSFGLSALLAEFMGVTSDKSHQRDDWRQRPLSIDSLHYAQMDTHYLIGLRDKLYDELKQGGYLTEAQELFVEACHVPTANGRHFDPDGYWHLGQPHTLNRREMAVLRELYLLRERLAEERDCPPFKIFSNTMLVTIAQRDPQTSDDLSQIPGLSPLLIRRYGTELLHAVKHGRDAKLPSPPRVERPDPITSDLYTALHDWRRRRAEQRGVESDVIMSKQTLWELARKVPTKLDDLSGIHGLGPWRLATYGTELLEVIGLFQGLE